MDNAAINEQRTKERAYTIWERAGQPDGQAGEHWAEAEREIHDEQQGSLEPMPRDEAGSGNGHAVPSDDGQLR